MGNDTITIPIDLPTDENGLTGRECPNSDCLGYFKIQFGTGLTSPLGEALPCHCPYCGHTESHDHFWTQDQIKRLEGIALNYVGDELFKVLKKAEFEHKPRGLFGIGISLKAERGPLRTLHSYKEKELETLIVCDQCTLRYSVYGKFAWCPDCRTHNSLQILNDNLRIVEKTLTLALTVGEAELSEQLIGDALENVVSALDGFGREACRVRAMKASDPAKAEHVSFQNLRGARKSIQTLFSFDLAGSVSTSDWIFISRCFQKRHLVAHKMGIIDGEYLKSANYPSAILGRKVTIKADEVRSLVRHVRNLGEYLTKNLP